MSGLPDNWNTFVEISFREYKELDPRQRPAHLVFFYESEVQNGGHLQFFENGGLERFEETLDALEFLGAECQRGVLYRAGKLFLAQPRMPLHTAEQYVAAAHEDDFGEFDTAFHKCSPSLTECLSVFLECNQSLYVET